MTTEAADPNDAVGSRWHEPSSGRAALIEEHRPSARRRGGIALASGLGLALVASLTACGNSDFDLSDADAVGTWRAGSGVGTELQLRSDRTFTAIGWPVDASCEPADPMSIDELVGTETRDLSGTWDETDRGGAVNNLVLSLGDGQCEWNEISMDFRREDGVEYSCILIGDSLTGPAESWFVLYLGEPPTELDRNTCFTYN